MPIETSRRCSKRGAKKFAPVEEAERGSAGGSHGERDVLRMVGNLPEAYRQVIMLFYMEERSYNEVAKMMDLPLGTVKTNLHRARKELGRMVKEAESGARRF